MYRSLRWRLTATHSIPLFEGRSSRQHQDVALWKLWTLARTGRIFAGRHIQGVETFLQFAGFPRSGHSLIGSIVDAHPQARISHELDTMGLYKKKFSQNSIFALIDSKAREFTRHGRYWNGFSYLIPQGHHQHATGLRVIGDKKGDLAVRWIAQDPALLDRLQNEGRTAKKWILVLRHPFDNIATMSLRKGRAYDVLRTTISDSEDFYAKLKEQQRQGAIAQEALDSQIDDYASLCQTVAMMKRVTPAENWLEVCYEDFAARPEAAIATILKFLGLSSTPDYLTNCAALVNKNINQSRRLIQWPPAKRARVESLCREFSFLNRYDHNDVG